MTEKELEIAVTAHEMQRLELKESFGAECVEAACAFANANGGYIVIGVDNKGRLAKSPLRTEALRDYENRIATATEPSVAVDAEKVAFRGGQVVVLEVLENPLKPVAAKGRSFIRKGSVNHQMTPAEIAECHLKSTGASMDAVIVPGVTRDDLDMDAVREYMAKAVSEGRRGFLPDEDPWLVLKKMQWVKSETEITRAAYLLFAKEPQIMFPQAIIHAGVFRDEGALILDSCDVEGNIQNQVEKAIEFIKRNIRRSIVVTGKAEHDRVWEYPIEALRETITNAVCHRDYSSPHDIQVKIMEDHLVVISPGLLPFDMDIDILEDPRHGSRPRNKLIAQAFYDIHLIEHYGSGIGRIKSECAKNGNGFPELSQKYGSFITVYDSRLKQETGVAGKRSPEGEFESAASGMNGGIKGGMKSGMKSGMNGGMKSEGDTKKDVKTETAILILLKSSSKMSIDVMSAKLLLSRNAVAKQLDKLKRKGAVRRVGAANGGYWEVVSDTISGTINRGDGPINEPVNDSREVVNEPVNGMGETVNETVNEIEKLVVTRPGIKLVEIVRLTKKSRATIARGISFLKDHGQIEYRGSDKTGGYYAVEQED